MKKIGLIVGVLLLIQVIFVSTALADGPYNWGGGYQHGGYYHQPYWSHHGYYHYPRYYHNNYYHSGYNYYYPHYTYYPRSYCNPCCQPYYGYRQSRYWY